MAKKIKKIPYGIADFELIRRFDYYYVDKTGFIPLIEAAGRYLFLIRPRRFGKSLWLSVLESYYDIAKKDRFREIFKGTWIGENPTEDHGVYLILRFNFSAVNPDPEKVEDSFETYCQGVFEEFLSKYNDTFTPEILSKLTSLPTITDRLNRLFAYGFRHDLRLCILIDEYDNFTNTILSVHGQKTYHDLTHGAGFLRHFFNVLKAGTTGSGSSLARLFITGVSPVTMDDVTSGFNIGRNISLEPKFDEMLGFTILETRRLISWYKDHGNFPLDTDEAFGIMQLWYNNYCFSHKSQQSVFNPDMVFYFMHSCIDSGDMPDDLIDQNVRIDYGKLRHLILVDKRFNGNFSRLKEIMEKGRIISSVTRSFPLEAIIQPENFISLLLYFGLLSFAPASGTRTVLQIPNLTVQKLMYGYMRDAYADVDIFRVDLWKLANTLGDMAYDGVWEPVFNFLADEVKNQTSVRDYLAGEKVIQGFLLAYLNLTDYFLPRTKMEMSKGFADIFLEPFWARFPDMGYGYVIELKYIKRGELTQDILEKKIAEAREQLDKYAQDDHVVKAMSRGKLKKIVLVYHGWEMIYRG
ncbi:MAG: AAA family ATPase [Deltaproteobacteria bacterium]|nr:AAA family ATPase [Deltaproteobacteria bacterium]MBW1833728.1 AAA family ATPase [Deltaproteobacteria bacterium]